MGRQVEADGDADMMDTDRRHGTAELEASLDAQLAKRDLYTVRAPGRNAQSEMGQVSVSLCATHLTPPPSRLPWLLLPCCRGTRWT